MFDKTRIPDILDLSIFCTQSLHIAEILEISATNAAMDGISDAQREEWERAISSVSVLTGILREISEVTDILSNGQKPEKYGFPAFGSDLKGGAAV